MDPGYYIHHGNRQQEEVNRIQPAGSTRAMKNRQQQQEEREIGWKKMNQWVIRLKA